MKRLFLAPIICALACSVWADGVPLITPGPALPASNPVQELWKKQPQFVKLHPIVLNQAAFGANVVTVVIDGKELRFVGSMLPPPALVMWRGYERGRARPVPEPAFITLQKHNNGVIDGDVFLPPNRRLDIATPPSLASSVLIETIQP